MSGRRLDPEESALWARVAATVTPLEGRAALPPIRQSDEGRSPVATVRPDHGLRRDDGKRKTAPPRTPGDTLDGGWDRRLRRGDVAPDATIDLHGHTLASAHAALEHALARAIAGGVRLLLVVTGRPPRSGEARRGLIRASIGDWLAISPHASRIAAVRAAHPRHGGGGALYLILRRPRPGGRARGG